MRTINDIPLSLYIHMPWCVKKCPYCDFNSHAAPANTQGLLADELSTSYVDALLSDLANQLDWVQGRSISSIFIGGGTPSLLAPKHYQRLLDAIRSLLSLSLTCEITMEANPGTLEYAPLADYKNTGINRLSIGVQSFLTPYLQQLGRIHSGQEAQTALHNASTAGFSRINVDLMHGLPNQTTSDALHDLQTAIDNGATHISWYQLTIEPNTVFYKTNPQLPEESVLADIQSQGEALLNAHGFKQYEVSAWTKELPSAHNVNYWHFGDYLAIGAGAHGKISVVDSQNQLSIQRYQKSRAPSAYLQTTPAPAIQNVVIAEQELAFEFMLNALRLLEGVPAALFTQRTGIPLSIITPTLQQLQDKKLLSNTPDTLVCTPLGMRYLNTVLAAFNEGA